MKPYLLSALLLFTVNTYATTTVDCESKEYKYSPTVHDACVEMQKMTVESRKEGAEKFSKILSQKQAVYQNALNEKKDAAKKTPDSSTPATPQPSTPGTPPNSPTTSPTPPSASAPPVGSVAPPNNTLPSVAPQSGQNTSPQQSKRGVNYY